MAKLGNGTDGEDVARERHLRRTTPLILRPRIHALLVAASMAGWLGITVLSLLPGRDRPHTGFPGDSEHALAYAIVAALTRLCLFGLPTRTQLAGFSGAAALFEIAQIWIPGRTAGVDNWLASTLGAAAGLLLARTLAHLSIRRSVPRN